MFVAPVSRRAPTARLRRVAIARGALPVRSWEASQMAKSRHKKPENVRRYFKLSPDAIAEIASLRAPGDSRR